MLRLTDGRPTRTLCWVSGTTTGRPGDGHGSSLSCAAYQSGSTHSSATHSTGIGVASWVGAGAGAAGAGVASGGRGMVPVVKS